MYFFKIIVCLQVRQSESVRQSEIELTMTMSKIDINDKIKRGLLFNRLMYNGLSLVQFINQLMSITFENHLKRSLVVIIIHYLKSSNNIVLNPNPIT